MSKKESTEQAKSTEPIKEVIEIDPGMINNILAATTNMHGEITFLMQDVKAMMEVWEKRLQSVEDQRKEQLLASQTQLDEIEKAEMKGFSINDKTFVAHMLGTNQLIFEGIGRMQSDIDEIKSGLKIIDHRTVSFEMEQVLMREQIADIKKKWLPIISNQSKILALALLTIALSLGLGSFLKAVTWW